mmetsp:Transcript_2688/g.7473  ORF Transcript_2688/g.7473 Transcript_2688/m.7473 type:complete len:200 (-) Transcript_2688:45-644(-)
MRYCNRFLLTPRSDSPMREDERTSTTPLLAISSLRSSMKGLPPLKNLAKLPMPDLYSMRALPLAKLSSTMVQPPRSALFCPSCGYASMALRNEAVASAWLDPAGGTHCVRMQFCDLAGHASRALAGVAEAAAMEATPKAAAAVLEKAARRLTSAPLPLLMLYAEAQATQSARMAVVIRMVLFSVAVDYCWSSLGWGTYE